MANFEKYGFSCSVRRSGRARRMRLAVHCDGSVVATVPKAMPPGLLERFLRDKTDWIRKKVAFFKGVKRPFFASYGRKEYLQSKDQALELAKERVNFFNQFYQAKFKKISVKNQKARWGSCSTKGNLNFNYKILFLPEKARDYIIVHEICHLREFNHSKNFWNLVRQTIPDYLEIKKELKRNYLKI
ncbi:M48 family peptidase [Candidatus Parcubacteria bacterium]|nr:MAG: M48 family peptidase [Candidatus Parcubacteria bacterium]